MGGEAEKPGFGSRVSRHELGAQSNVVLSLAPRARLHKQDEDQQEKAFLYHDGHRFKEVHTFPDS